MQKTEKTEIEFESFQREKLDRIGRFERNISSEKVRKLSDGIFLAIFFAFFIIPIFYIFIWSLFNWNAINFAIFNNPISGATRASDIGISLLRSLFVASVVVLADIIIGIPMAIILARYEFRGKRLLDTLVDLPLAIPTAALGFSIYLFWGAPQGIAPLLGIYQNPIQVLSGTASGGGLIEPGLWLIILAHIPFTFPYITRNLKVVIGNIDKDFEDAARSLGAQKYTVFRTITGPLMKEGLIAGAILAFTRSIGETGATLLVYGVEATAPIQVVTLTRLGQYQAAGFLSMILVSISIGMLFLVKTVSRRVGLPVQRIWYGFEKIVSKKPVRVTRDTMTMILFIGVITIPSFYVLVYLFTNFVGVEGAFYSVFYGADNKWAEIWVQLINSLSIAGIATLVNILIGIPLAFMIVRRKWGKFNMILDTAVDLPLTVPSAALGFAIFLFWGTLGPFAPTGIFTPGYMLILIVHVVFTLPFMVRVLVAVLMNMSPGFEEASSTMGASRFTTFRKITLPMLKTAILAGAIMVFMRSLGETGATVVVMGLIRTVPVGIIDYAESIEFEAAAFSSFVIILISFVLIFVLRYLSGEEREEPLIKRGLTYA